MPVADAAEMDRDASAPSLSDATEAVCTLAGLMSRHGLAELDLSMAGLTISLRSGTGSAAPLAPVAAEAAAAPAQLPEPPVDGHVITAPMIGTFYTAPGPGQPPFVQIGDRVEAGQVIGIIEAMKIMNEIAADRGGVVQDVLVKNAQAVEYGSPLMRVTPERG
jgi:acetyl-CoA carboxylase biotin carboxyl carrier protein